jgi:hypothetical protein
MSQVAEYTHDAGGTTERALCTAVQADNADAFNLILDTVADPLAEIGGATCIFGVVRASLHNLYYTERVLKAAATRSRSMLEDHLNRTERGNPLFLAMHRGMYNVATLLMKYGARLDIEPTSIPGMLIMQGSSRLVDQLLFYLDPPDGLPSASPIVETDKIHNVLHCLAAYGGIDHSPSLCFPG